MALLKKNKSPKNQESGFIRNTIIYGVLGIISFVTGLWYFGLILVAIAVFNGFMAHKHYGEPTDVNKQITGIKNFLDKNYEPEETEFGNLQTNNKAYNAQKKWNELEEARNRKLYGEPEELNATEIDEDEDMEDDWSIDDE